MSLRYSHRTQLGHVPGSACYYLILGLFLVLASCAHERAERYVSDLSHPDSGTRRAASQELVALGGPAVEPLLAVAEDAPDSLRFIVVQVLGSIGDHRALPLLQRLSTSDNPFVAREAVISLGKCGGPDTAAHLTGLLVTAARNLVRRAAAEALGNLRDTTAVPALIAAMGDTSAEVRRGALTALHRLWTDHTHEAVGRALHDRDETVRFIAAQILGQRHVVESGPALATALADSSLWVRAEAARALGSLGDPAAVGALEALLRRCDGPDCEAARQALLDLTDTEYILIE